MRTGVKSLLCPGLSLLGLLALAGDGSAQRGRGGRRGGMKSDRPGGYGVPRRS